VVHEGGRAVKSISLVILFVFVFAMQWRADFKTFALLLGCASLVGIILTLEDKHHG
jgi:hypothetical protein